MHQILRLPSWNAYIFCRDEFMVYKKDKYLSSQEQYLKVKWVYLNLIYTNIMYDNIKGSSLKLIIES